jgi:hypothetical protein
MTHRTEPGSRRLCAARWGAVGLAILVLAGCSIAPVSPPARVVPRPGDGGTVAPARGVCPPFPLRDEAGAVIDPVHGRNDTVPYSPKQTCGASGCHDYAVITKGFHFTQGQGEPVPPDMAARYAWVSSPGNYGGTWCSPAPLYRQLAPKTNTDARLIDLTSFAFVTATCGNCHPGGGPLEFDRDGRRYDERMRDPAAGMTPGGDNGLDGDYYQARWSETGVIEADCLLCHDAGYDHARRNATLADLNFRWAATAGARLGTIEGRVAAGEAPRVRYDASRFDADGNVRLSIAPEPRNETCLVCHAKPGWKKRGASYAVRTDVHIQAGLRCVDCHAAGSRAADPRIAGREEHQLGKGDDPSGRVRDDLDDTVRSCEDCHLAGWRNAPRATHAWLPPLHLEELSCQACHIPSRAVKAALVQASDVYNPGPRIEPPPKHIWTFYDQEMNYWNHYGELNLFGHRDQPTNVTRPTLVRYKGKIYPANRVHSSWVGYEVDGQPGLQQLFMKDFFQMWVRHRSEGAYPELAAIQDDDRDGVAEVNRPEEIDALLAGVRAHLTATGFPLEGRRLVWVSGDRAWSSGTESRPLPRAPHEATAYASVYKYSHDIAPAGAALGAGGCPDCHRADSPFFAGAVLATPFGPDGQPRWIANADILDLAPAWVALGALREGTLKPILYALLVLLGVLATALAVRAALGRATTWSARRTGLAARIVAALLAAAAVVVALVPDLAPYMTVPRFALDANHFGIAAALLAVGLSAAVLAWRTPARPARLVSRAAGGAAGVVALSGAVMLLGVGGVGRLAYTLFDAGLVVLALATSGLLILRLAENGGPAAVAPGTRQVLSDPTPVAPA